MNNSKILNDLGLAYRASKISIGSDDTILKLKSKKVFLVFMDKNMSSDTEKQIIKLCDLYSVQLIRNFTKDELSHAIGKRNISVIGITDKGFGELMNKSL